MMYGRAGLDRFKKAQSLEPFSVSTVPSGSKPSSHSSPNDSLASRPLSSEAGPPPVTQVGGGQSSWQPPDWAVEPRAGVHYLEVLKDGEVLDRINIDRRRQIFGRQFPMCDFVLDHPSVSRQHAVVVPHKNGSVYVIDLGSVHGTFVANERLTKDNPVELEAGQSLRFAASTRTYILRKNEEALFSHPPPLSEADLPPIPDPSDEDAVVAYNTLMNQYGIRRPVIPPKPRDPVPAERPAKRVKKVKVSFRDQVGGELVEVVGFSDGADVETEKLGPIGVKEGALVGKYESLVQVTVIPKGKEQSTVAKEGGYTSPKGVTGKLQEVLDKVKRGTPKSGLYDDLYGESFVGKVGSSWAYSSVPNKDALQNSQSVKAEKSSSQVNDDDDDDLFGD